MQPLTMLLIVEPLQALEERMRRHVYDLGSMMQFTRREVQI